MTEVTIRSIATGGDGVATLPDGMTVFVPRTAPGDVARVEVVKRHRRWARGHVRAIVRPGPERVTPPCEHYVGDGCGGCQLQHVRLSGQELAKRDIVREALARLGGRQSVPVTFVSAPAAWGYRTKVTLTVQRGRIGFRRFDRPGDVFDVARCPIAEPALATLFACLRRLRMALPSGVRQLVLRLDREGGRHVVVRGGTAPFDASGVVGTLPEGTTLWWEPSDGAARTVAGAGSAFPVLAFQQVNPTLADRIRIAAVQWVGVERGAVAWDLYGGVGDTTRLMVDRGAQVWSVDADRTAIGYARSRHGDTTPTPEFIVGLVEEALSRLPRPEVVIMNPPRRGLHARVTAVLEGLAAEHRAPRVAYVSCDPATLARDLRRMPSYRLAAVTAYDLFPQTSHVEVLAGLEAA